MNTKAALVTLGLLAALASVSAQKPEVFADLKYRYIGPQGNRVIALAGVPGDPGTVYVGAASGGIFKTTDGGINWKPIFDDQPVSSIGSLAIAPSDPNVVWAGTGETFIRSNVSQGMGIYKSTDAGKTWTLMGLEKTGRIGRIVIHPANPDVVLAAAMGHCYGPQQERGVFRTIDGGKTWDRVLFTDEDTGASDLVMDPNNPRILFAGMWTMLIRTWGRWSGGPGSGLFMSRDGGTTWKRLEKGLPASPVGKVAVAMSAANSNRVYALIEHDSGVLWRSDDGGENWRLINRDHTLTQRPHYYSRMAVEPDNANEMFFAATRFSHSLDGGETSKVPSVAPGGDNHEIWIDPKLPNRVLVGNDAGVRLSMNRGETWFRPHLPIAQMYHVAVDDLIPYYVYGNRQDGASGRGPSNSRMGGTISSSLWRSVGGCESGFAVPDPKDNNIVWSGCYEGLLDRYDLRTGHSREVQVWPDDPLSWPASAVKYRFQWNFPIAISPHDHNTVYVGSQHVHQTTTAGQSWTVISPDLTLNDKKMQEKTGGLTPDDASPTYGSTLFAIAESPLEKGLIWTGSNDGQVQVTRDAGKTWTNVTVGLAGLPPHGTVSNIEPSRYDAAAAYLTMDLHQVNSRDPWVFKTTDYGKTWKNISSDIPKSELSYAHCVREDPKRKGLLYLGTENALYLSHNDGGHWIPLQTNLPRAPVHWLVVQERFNDLVVATYGRGFWILDDLGPVQQLTTPILDSAVHLFAPRPTYRFRGVAATMTHPDDASDGRNPPQGAALSYYLKAEPKGDVKITILDARGQVVRTITSGPRQDEREDEGDEGARRAPPIRATKKAGINRIWWNLLDEGTEQIRLRTSPIGAPWVAPGPRGWRPAGQRVFLLAPPGTYTVKLEVDGQTSTEQLTVLKDPNSTGSEADLSRQTKVLTEIRDSLNAVAGMINRIELARRQILDLTTRLGGDKDVEPVLSAGRALEQKLLEFEQGLIQLKLTGGTAGQDSLRWEAMLDTKLASLASNIAKSDFAPTDQQAEVHEMFQQEVGRHNKRFSDLVSTDLAGFNKLLRDRKVENITIPAVR